MRSNRSKGPIRSRRGFRLRVEALELRLCLSGSPGGHPNTHTPPPPVSIVFSGHTLNVFDSNSGDTIFVSDDGQGDVNVLVTGAGGAKTMGNGHRITAINVDATGGNDTVDYANITLVTVATGDNATSPEAVADTHGNNTPGNHGGAGEIISIHLAKGGNTADLGFGPQASANLSVNVEADGGGNTVTEEFVGNVQGSHLRSSFEGTGGKDSFNATMTGDLSASDARFDVIGLGGADNLGLTANGQIAADSLLAASLSGGFKGGDTINFGYTGELLGKLGVSTVGGGGNETIAQNITVDQGSTGTLDALVLAGKGSAPNNLTLAVIDNSGPHPNSMLSALNAYLFYHPGDTITVTSNVQLVKLPIGWFGFEFEFGFGGWFGFGGPFGF